MLYKDTRQSSDFAVCHRELTAKLRFCRVPTVRHSAKNHFAVCFFVALGKNLICRVLNFCREFFCLALGIYCVPVMLLTAKSQEHGKPRVSRSGVSSPFELYHAHLVLELAFPFSTSLLAPAPLFPAPARCCLLVQRPLPYLAVHGSSQMVPSFVCLVT